jgi:chromosome segregation protein
MVEQKREMRVLAEEVHALERRAAELGDEHRRIRTRMAEVGTSLDRAREGAHESELAHVSAEKDLARTVSERARAATRKRTIEAELAELDAAVERAVQEDTECRRQLDEVTRRLADLEQALAKANESASSWRERVASRTALVTEKKVRLAQVREQVEAARTAREKVEEALQGVVERAERLALESNETARTFGETAAGIVSRREQRFIARADAERAHEEHEEVRRLLDQIRHALGEREAALKALRAELGTSDETVRGYELKLQKLELEREHLLQSVREKFRGLDLHRVVGKYHARPAPDADHRRRVDELTKLIERMGPVNLDAQVEFEDAEKRFVDLSRQKEDIDNALTDLERAIKHMNRESRRRFKETFESVNELFKTTFTKLFRGGRAELMLTNPEDLLETGVDIIAQPPGKRLGNIELMSGGEKALTATSLIFAIFQHRPSPFCVLDEVDAPLDEANVTRYNDAIRSMTDRSQFILITHIKSTMQTVDVLYGVTMGEPGVSRIVSVKVNEEARTRSDRGPGELERPARQHEDAPSRSPQVA